MTLPKLIKIENLKEFADKVSGKYFYILKKYSNDEYLIQIEEDKSTQYDFIIPIGFEINVIFKIVGDIDKKKKYKAFLLDNDLIIYEPEYYEKEFENIIKNSIELKEENKKIEDLFNQLRSVLAKGIPSLPEFQTEQIEEKGQSIIEIEKAEDRPIDQKQFNVFEELYKEADIQKRLKRVKLYETEKKVEEKEEEYGLKDEDAENDNEGDDDEWCVENKPWQWKNWN